MRVGTRSVLYGAHAFWLHPWFVAAAWWRLYGFPWDPRLWVAFFVHDLGYIGKSNMDGSEGESHVCWGGYVMGALFGQRWYWFSVLHSRFWAGHHKTDPSRLCFADKLAIAVTPWWTYVPMVRATGEIREYRKVSKHRAEMDSPQHDISFHADRVWFLRLQRHMRKWVAANV